MTEVIRKIFKKSDDKDTGYIFVIREEKTIWGKNDQDERMAFSKKHYEIRDILIDELLEEDNEKSTEPAPPGSGYLL